MNELDVAAYIDQQLPPSERERIEAHAAICGDCRRELVDAQRILQQSARPRRRAWMLTGVGIAAVAIIAVSLPRDSAVMDERVRASNAEAPLVVYGPLGEVAISAPRFVWAPALRSASYHLTLQSEGGATLWAVNTSDTTLALPDSVRLTSGATYVWSVDVLRADGTTQTTGLRQFQLRK